MTWAQQPMPSPQLAGWWYRVGASVIDGILLGVVGLILGAAAGSTGARYALSTILGLAYTGLLLAYRRQTVGMMALSTRCVDARTGGPISLGRALGRTLVADLLGITVIGGILDVLWPLWDDQNQTLHDKAVGSLVVMARSQVAAPPYPGAPGTFGPPVGPAGGWTPSDQGWSTPASPAPPPQGGWEAAPGNGWETAQPHGGGWEPAKPQGGGWEPAQPQGGGWEPAQPQAGGWQAAGGSAQPAPSGPLAPQPAPSAPQPAPVAPQPTPAAPPVPEQSIPAAWYPDPAGSGQERWWDGKSWTEHLRPRS